jgi:hypothetical protein
MLDDCIKPQENVSIENVTDHDDQSEGTEIEDRPHPLSVEEKNAALRCSEKVRTSAVALMEQRESELNNVQTALEYLKKEPNLLPQGTKEKLEILLPALKSQALAAKKYTLWATRRDKLLKGDKATEELFNTKLKTASKDWTQQEITEEWEITQEAIGLPEDSNQADLKQIAFNLAKEARGLTAAVQGYISRTGITLNESTYRTLEWLVGKAKELQEDLAKAKIGLEWAEKNTKFDLALLSKWRNLAAQRYEEATDFFSSISSPHSDQNLELYNPDTSPKDQRPWWSKPPSLPDANLKQILDSCAQAAKAQKKADTLSQELTKLRASRREDDETIIDLEKEHWDAMEQVKHSAAQADSLYRASFPNVL